MPSLNWRDISIQQKRSDHERFESKIELVLTKELVGELVSSLEEFYFDPGREFRLDLPEGWIVFWKWRESENRFLVAHPNPDEWVMTVAIVSSFAENLIRKLKSLSSGQSLTLSELGEASRVSNLELVITVG